MVSILEQKSVSVPSNLMLTDMLWTVGTIVSINKLFSSTHSDRDLDLDTIPAVDKEVLYRQLAQDDYEAQYNSVTHALYSDKIKDQFEQYKKNADTELPDNSDANFTKQETKATSQVTSLNLPHININPDKQPEEEQELTEEEQVLQEDMDEWPEEDEDEPDEEELAARYEEEEEEEEDYDWPDEDPDEPDEEDLAEDDGEDDDDWPEEDPDEPDEEELAEELEEEEEDEDEWPEEDPDEPDEEELAEDDEEEEEWPDEDPDEPDEEELAARYEEEEEEEEDDEWPDEDDEEEEEVENDEDNGATIPTLNLSTNPGQAPSINRGMQAPQTQTPPVKKPKPKPLMVDTINSSIEKTFRGNKK